jgi:hypothetical protein
MLKKAVSFLRTFLFHRQTTHTAQIKLSFFGEQLCLLIFLSLKIRKDLTTN